MKKFFLMVAAGLVVLGFTSFYLASCSSSGGGTAAPAGSPGFSRGVITAKGSIFVNGVEYETTSSSISKDGTSGHSDGELHVGMVVEVSGRFDDDDRTGEGAEIEYSDNVEGPVTAASGTALPLTLTVLGQEVLVDAQTHILSSITGTDADVSAILSALGASPLVEVSGMTDTAGSIHATFIELKDTAPSAGEDVEVKGSVSALNTGANTFKINALTVVFDGATQMKEFPAGGIADGQFVEIKSTLSRYVAATQTMTATEIEYETPRTPRESDNIEIEGFVADYNAAAKTFTVRELAVNASGIAVPASLANGSIVEVHGTYAGGAVTATRIELKTHL